MHEFKSNGELYIMTMKNDAKFEQELTSQFKVEIKNLTNVNPSNQNFQKFALKWVAFNQSK